MTTEVEDFLAHYGVKGMRWGVRKPNEGSENSDSNDELDKKKFKITKKQALIGASVIVGVAATALILSKSGHLNLSDLPSIRPLSEKDLELGRRESTMRFGQDRYFDLLKERGSETGLSLPQGQIFSRMSTVAENTLNGATYSTYKNHDNDVYLSGFVRDRASAYQIKIESLSEIRMPDSQARIDTLINMVDTPMKEVEFKGKTLRNFLASEQPTRRAKAYVKSVSDRDLAEHAFGKYMAGGNFKEGVAKEFLGRIKDQGYDAFKDDVDGSFMSDTPLILINPSKFKINSATKVGDEDIAAAAVRVTEYLKKNGGSIR